MTSAWANQYATSNRTQSLWQGRERLRLRRFLLLPAPTRVSAPYGWSVNTRIVASVMQGRYYACALNLSYSGVIPGSNRELPELNRQFFVYECMYAKSTDEITFLAVATISATYGTFIVIVLLRFSHA